MSESMTIALPAGALEGTAATLSEWLVSEGALVKKGDPILELETDKVSMEVCAEVDGVIAKILAASGENVDEKTILGYIEQASQASKEGKLASESSATKDQSSATKAQLSETTRESTQSADNLHDDSENASSRRHLIGPAVRKLLRQHNLDIDHIPGTGKGNRVTRNDILQFIKDGGVQRIDANPVESQKGNEKRANTSGSLIGKKIPHTTMRKKIASHMVESLLHTSPHVTSVFEMDMGRIIEHRKQCKMGFEEAGVKLTFTAYFLAASAKAMQKVPVVNSRFHDDCLEIFEDINIGVGTALGDDGLIVPVVKQVQEKNLFEIASALQQQTDKARQGKLVAADMRDGTFTISNHGVSGSLFATPIIINQPQVAILGIGKLEKRVVVEEVNGEDIMVIRPKCYVSLSIDHRALDAHQTNLFLAHFVEVIENWGK